MRKVVAATEEIVNPVVIENKYLVGEELLLQHCHLSLSSGCPEASAHGGGLRRTKEEDCCLLWLVLDFCTFISKIKREKKMIGAEDLPKSL